MAGILNTVVQILKKLVFFMLQFLYVIFYWITRFLALQIQGWKRRSAQKELRKAFSDLGADIYALHKLGERDWENRPSVERELKTVEEAESRLFAVDAAVEGIHSTYLNKKERVCERYGARRAGVGVYPSGPGASSSEEV